MCEQEYKQTPKHEKEEDNHVAPDGGWGWMVAAGVFLNTFLFSINIFAFSLMYAKTLQDNNTPTTTTAWIFNLALFNWNIAQIFLPSLCDEFGWRRVGIFAGCLAGLSTIFSGWIERSEYLFITTSFINGFGGGLGTNIMHFIITQYFDIRRGRVIGLVTTAFSVNQFIIPILVKNLQDSYGHRGALFILGAIILNTIVGSMLFEPIQRHWKSVEAPTKISNEIEIKIEPCEDISRPDSPVYHTELLEDPQSSLNTRLSENLGNSRGSPYCSMSSLSVYSMNMAENDQQRKVSKHSSGEQVQKLCLFKKMCSIFKGTFSHISTLKNFRVVIFTVSASLAARTRFNVVMLIPFAVLAKGFSMELAAYCLSVMGICNMVAQPTIASLTDFLPIRKKYYFMGGSLISAISIFGFSLTNNTALMLVCMGLYGVGCASISCINTLLAIETFGLKRLPSTIGAYGVVSLFFSPTVGPLIGSLRDVLEDYDICLKIVAIVHLIPFCLWMMMPLATKLDLKTEAGKRF